MKTRLLYSSEIETSYQWQNDQQLILSLTCSGEGLSKVNLDGALDQDGYDILNQPVFSFSLITPQTFYTYNIKTKEEQLIYEPLMEIVKASVSKNKKLIQFSDITGGHDGWTYDHYVLDLDSKQLIKWEKENPFDLDGRPPTVLIDSGEYRYGAKGPYSIIWEQGWNGSIYVQEPIKNIDFKQYYPNMIFSPDGKKAGIFTIPKSDVYPEGEFPIVFSIYDVESGKLVKSYSDLIYAMLDEERIYFNPPYAFWIKNDQILIEDVQDGPRISLFNIKNDTLTTIVTGKRQPILSPTGKHFVAVENREGASIYDIKGKLFGSFKTVDYNNYTVHWSDKGDRIVYTAEDGIYMYDLNQKNSNKIGENIKVAGWLDEEQILIYK